MTDGADLEGNEQVCSRYIELLNAQDFDSLPEVVDPSGTGRSVSASPRAG